jgi:hypothetical protein
MKRSQVRIIHYARNSVSNGWVSTGTDISDQLDFQSSQSIETNADTFQIPLKNTDALPVINIDDRIDVFVANSASGVFIGTTASDYTNYFLFNGTVEETHDELVEDGANRLVVQGANATQLLMRTLLPAGVYKQDTISVNNQNVSPTVPNQIQTMFEFINQSNPAGRQLVWSPDNKPTKEDGTAFPPISYSTNYKPVYNIIADLSTDAYTGDGDYYFYLKINSSGQNEFVWKKRTILSDSYSTLVEGTDFSARTIPYGTWDVVNTVILHCGTDANNKGILTFYYGSPRQKTANIGSRPKYMAKDIAGKIIADESSQSGSAYVFVAKYPGTYPYVTKYAPSSDDWKLYAGVFKNQKFFGTLSFVNYVSAGTSPERPTSGGSENLHIIVNSDSQFNSFVRNAARLLGRKFAKSVVDLQGYARYKVDATLYEGRNTDTLGALYKIESATYDWTNDSEGDKRKVLRLSEIKHTIGNDGWNTKLSFIEDWRTVALEVGV